MVRRSMVVVMLLLVATLATAQTAVTGAGTTPPGTKVSGQDIEFPGNVKVGTTCPEGAPAGSICFLGTLYQNGVEFSGGNGSGVPSTSATDGQFLTGFAGSAFTKAKADFNKLDNKPTLGTAAAAATTDFAAASHTQAISTITDLQTALDAKVPTTTTVAGHALSANVTVSKTDVGLGNVDNTADSAKPVSTATQTALDGKAASNAATTVNSQSCALGGSCTVTADPTSAKYKTTTCAVGLGDGLNAIPTGDYVLDGQCLNNKATVTISSIKCFSDAGSSTGNVADNSTNALLTVAVTATSSWATGTQSATTTLDLGAWTKWTLHADGTSKQIDCVLTGSY